MSTRINARLDDALARQLDEIRRMTGQSLTELLEAALSAYCRQMAETASTPYAAFQKAGFLGSGAGPRNLSRDYKKHLERSLSQKK
jgi:predicted transcriptional regulator